MPSDPRLSELLRRWKDGKEGGQAPSAGDLCAARPGLGDDQERWTTLSPAPEPASVSPTASDARRPAATTVGAEGDAPAGVPVCLGRYRILAAVGAGGFGAV